MKLPRSEALDEMILDGIGEEAVNFYYGLLNEILPAEELTEEDAWDVAMKTLKEVMPEDRFEGHRLSSILHSLRCSDSLDYSSEDTYKLKPIILVYLTKNESDIFSTATNDFLDDIDFDENSQIEVATEVKGEWIA